MGTRVLVQNYNSSDNDNDGNNLRSTDSYIEDTLNDADSQPAAGSGEIDRISDVDREAITEDSLEHDEGSNTVDCLDEPYKDPIRILTIGVEDDRCSLESSGSLRNHNSLTAKDVLPIETARARFLQIIIDHFISEHLIEKRGPVLDNIAEHGEDKLNKRKSGEVQYEGDPRFVLPLMYVANLYGTLVNEVNIRIGSLNGLREKTIGVALEASGGLYRKLSQKFPKSGSYSFKRRELATSMETRSRFPELVVQEEKRVRFVVANGLDIVEKPNSVPSDDAEWFKRLTGRTEVAITARDYKFYNPRHKVRRGPSNGSPTTPGLLSPREQETPPKQPVARQPKYHPINLNHHLSHNHNQQTTLLSCTHETGQPSHLPEIANAHQPLTLSENIAAFQPLTGGLVAGRLNIMPTSPAKFCDECGSPYLRATSKFCSQCGTKRFGI